METWPERSRELRKQNSATLFRREMFWFQENQKGKVISELSLSVPSAHS